MIVYQLACTGLMLNFESRHRISSRQLYRSQEAALANASLFEEKCCSGGGLNDLRRGTTQVSVIELELED